MDGAETLSFLDLERAPAGAEGRPARPLFSSRSGRSSWRNLRTSTKGVLFGLLITLGAPAMRSVIDGGLNLPR